MRLTLSSLVLLFSLGNLSANVQTLANLADASSWQPTPAATAQGKISTWPDRLAVEFKGDAKQVFDLRLNETLDIPDWADNWTLVMNAGGTAGRVNVRAIVRDADGAEFLYRLLDWTPELAEGYPVFKAGLRNIPVRLNAVGLKRPNSSTGRWQNVERIGGGRAVPKPPLQLTGLRFEAGSIPAEGVLALGDFAWTRLVPSESQFYYALEGTERFGELDPVPYVTLAQLGARAFYGEIFDVEWELRDSYAGRPIQRGAKTFRLSANDPAQPYALQLDQRVEFPVTKPGAYWLATKLRWGRNERTFPETIEEKTFRLDVIRSRLTDTTSPAPSASSAPAIDIAPDRDSRIYSPHESLIVPVVFTPDRALDYRISVRASAGFETLKEFSASLPAGKTTTIPVDLSGLAESGGAWIVRAEIRDGDKLLDAKERLIGQLPASSSAAAPIRAFDSDRWQNADPTGGESLVILSAQLPDNARDDARLRWDAIQPFLNNAASVTQNVEITIRWKDISPLPGIIDWTWVDRMMDQAAARGLRVILEPIFVSMEPEWIPPAFRQNSEGGVFGHKRYLFRGMRTNLWHAPELRNPLVSTVSEMALRYRGHPAMGGYLILTEQPGDFPYTGWFDGYDPETLADFHRHLQTRPGGLAALNERWGTHYRDWSDIGVPDASASLRRQRDWLVFRYETISSLLLDQARAVRAADPDTHLEIYGDGLTAEQATELHRLGAILANGGAHEPELMGLTKARFGPYRLQERSEEHSVGRWSAYSPYQLDSTLFNLMLGGGQSAHIKMFTRTNEPLDNLRKPPYSLDRFERFIPIWRELRDAEAPARDVFVLNNRNARLMKTGGTTFLSFGGSSVTRSVLESQVVAPLADVPVATSGRVLFALSLFGTSYESSLSDSLVDYVREGGTLVMTADAGRIDPDKPGEDWLLLKRFGWQPPAGDGRNTNLARARTVADTIFSEGGKPLAFSGIVWRATDTSGVAATFDDGSPALAWKSFGKGRVVVVWATDLVPPAQITGSTRLVADIARWAGVSLATDSTDPRLYTNLLTRKSDSTFYGLVYHSGAGARWGQEAPAISAQTRWTLPDGNYAVHELISDKNLGTHSSARLRDQGLDSDLPRHAVAIYRLTRIQP